MIAHEWLGCVDYADGLRRQRDRQRAIIDGVADEVLWMCEHPDVVTTGRRSVDDIDIAALRRRGVTVVETERGGLATWHGPGQLVGYPIVDLGKRGFGVKAYVRALERGLLNALAELGVFAQLQDAHPGAWVGDAKIAAIGVNVRRGVTMHGFALNLCPDLSAFSGFIPCGLAWASITSVERETGRYIQPASAAPAVAECIGLALSDAARG